MIRAYLGAARMSGAAVDAGGALLDVRGLRAQYGPTQVLHGIDFAVAEGGITTILGANGAGKTTTAARGLQHGPHQRRGAPRRRRASTARRPRTIVRRGVAHVPDGRGTFMNLSVEENLRLGALHARATAPRSAPTSSACTATSRA